MVLAIRASLEGEGTQAVTWEQVKLVASSDGAGYTKRVPGAEKHGWGLVKAVLWYEGGVESSSVGNLTSGPTRGGRH